MEFDKENKNDFWAQAERLEIWELQSLQSFRSIGKKKLPRGYKMIPIFFAYDVKEDFRLKARMVAGGHVLPPPLRKIWFSPTFGFPFLLVFESSQFRNIII